MGRADYFSARAGHGPAFSGPDGPRVSVFRPRACSGHQFWPIFADFSAQSANYEVRARSGYPKFGPGRAGPTKKHGPRAEFRAGPWPDPSLVHILIFGMKFLFQFFKGSYDLGYFSFF